MNATPAPRPLRRCGHAEADGSPPAGLPRTHQAIQGAGTVGQAIADNGTEAAFMTPPRAGDI